MTIHSVTIRIGVKDLEILIQNGYNLCLSRDVQQGSQTRSGNVVFSSLDASKLAPSVRLQWDADKSQVYGTTVFQPGAEVVRGTDVANIQGGQTATIDIAGQIDLTGSIEPGKAFEVTNGWQQGARIGVNSFEVARNEYTSCYISPQVLKDSTTKLFPLPKYSVFWDTELTTNIMFDHTSTPPFPFELMGSPEVELQYMDGIWTFVRSES